MVLQHFSGTRAIQNNKFGTVGCVALDKFGNITPSTLLQDKIIPLSESKINYINECGIERIIYWTIYSIKCNNINQGIKYKLVWN